MVSGVAPTYESLHNDIERIVSMKASKYKIPSFEREDIAQEIRMVAFKALQKWDFEKNHSTPFHYIARCVDNYLINKRRDNDAVLPSKNPSPKDISRIEEKKKIYYPQSLSDIDLSSTFNGKSYPFELYDSFIKILPSSLHCAWSGLIDYGENSISRKDFTKIRKIFIEYYFPKD